MKKDQDIETLLTSGKNLSLSSNEKNEIKSVLLARATKDIQQKRKSIVSPWSSWIIRSSVSFASLLLVFVGTAYASQDSLPGEPLYAMKVHVVEEMVAITKISPEDKVAYDTILMEKRLEELQQIIVSEDATEPEALEVIATQIDDHVTHTTEVLETSTTDELTHESKIETLAKINGITKAQSKIARQNKELAPIAVSIEEVNDSASETLTSTVEDFINERTPEEVNTYLSEQITDIGTQIQASTTDEVTTQHLNNVNEALADGKTDEALISILEAQETIDANSLIEQTATEQVDDSI